MNTDTLNTFSPDEADYMAQVDRFIAACDWFQARIDCLLSAAKYDGDSGAQALMDANEAATMHVLHNGAYDAQPVVDFIGLVNAARISEAHHA